MKHAFTLTMTLLACPKYWQALRGSPELCCGAGDTGQGDLKAGQPCEASA